ncbi:MAG: AlpA family phage regulatory protein [Pseudomonas sp.]|jgi:prophage regulatory protein|uniref:helix-turn-helix transcriptional regulator n=1 Tax=Pseudomonadaceae TaxID=135621 RepID=UPI0009E5C644|nr:MULTISPECIES: AlpA family phage regulatory protein [Pseudomonadaceae]MAL34645.1 AlpA family phage regulatory protein [Pseudomonas sp.]MBK3795219.1 AlpA family phage regulatory protein [Stutzerimonas stutzeri]MBK3878428.1 AlpA family phage regulatory protein [Stutzerimonas stutzeri]HBM09603.1 AlpA family phage regulatory protein [Pseudomonas sp.]
MQRSVGVRDSNQWGFDDQAVDPVLRLKTLSALLGVGRSTIYDWMNCGSPRYNPSFPRPIRLSGGSRGAVGWLSSDVVRWLDSVSVADRAGGRQ